METTSQFRFRFLLRLQVRAGSSLIRLRFVASRFRREAVLERIILICSQKSFVFISDFEWYITTLVDLTHLQGIT